MKVLDYSISAGFLLVLITISPALGARFTDRVWFWSCRSPPQVRFGLDFMELRHAPIPLRAAFEFYCFAIWAVLTGLYLWL